MPKRLKLTGEVQPCKPDFLVTSGLVQRFVTGGDGLSTVVKRAEGRQEVNAARSDRCNRPKVCSDDTWSLTCCGVKDVARTDRAAERSRDPGGKLPFARPAYLSDRR